MDLNVYLGKIDQREASETKYFVNDLLHGLRGDFSLCLSVFFFSMHVIGMF